MSSIPKVVCEWGGPNTQGMSVKYRLVKTGEGFFGEAYDLEISSRKDAMGQDTYHSLQKTASGSEQQITIPIVALASLVDAVELELRREYELISKKKE